MHIRLPMILALAVSFCSLAAVAPVHAGSQLQVFSITKAPVAPDGTTAGRPADFVITVADRDPAISGIGIVTGGTIEAVLPSSFVINPSTSNGAVPLQGWPQSPPGPPPGGNFTVSVNAVTNTITVTMNVDFLPGGIFGPGFKQLHLVLLDSVNPGPGLYPVKITVDSDGPAGPADAGRLSESITKLLSRSREGTERVKKIVQDLRTFSRMDQAEIQEVDLHEEIDRTLALMEPRIKNNITVVRDYGALPKVRCFPGQLNQVFLNLLMNACDVLDENGTITIKTRRSEQGVRLEFGDNGPGIPEEIRGRLFDPFFTTKEVGRGTGLGLSLSHGIIERHRGRIAVSSEPGEGASFVIDLPLDVDSGRE
jgi:hypothetical protein